MPPKLKPPYLWRVRYRYLFMLMQIINVIRYNICPDYLNIPKEHFNVFTFLMIVVPHALAFLHALDPSKKNWDTVQQCMLLVILTYLFNIGFSAYSASEKPAEFYSYARDQLIYWHEVYLTTAMVAMARAEKIYHEKLEELEAAKLESESGGGGDKKSKKFKKRQGNSDEEERNENEKNMKTKQRFYH